MDVSTRARGILFRVGLMRTVRPTDFGSESGGLKNGEAKFDKARGLWYYPRRCPKAGDLAEEIQKGATTS
ncbi:MAG: hypothetical protein Kow00123_18280 [Anaerolineales bacterium]